MWPDIISHPIHFTLSLPLRWSIFLQFWKNENWLNSTKNPSDSRNFNFCRSTCLRLNICIVLHPHIFCWTNKNIFPTPSDGQDEHERQFVYFGMTSETSAVFDASHPLMSYVCFHSAPNWAAQPSSSHISLRCVHTGVSSTASQL